MQELLSVRLTELIQGGPNGKGTIIQYYCTAFPSAQVSLDYFNANQQIFYDDYTTVFQQALYSAGVQGLRTDIGVLPGTQNQSNNQNTQNQPAPTCPPTTITGVTSSSFIVVNTIVIPTAKTGDIISVGGVNLEYTRVVEVGFGKIGRAHV